MGSAPPLAARLKHRVVRSRAWTAMPGKYRRCIADCGRAERPAVGQDIDEYVDYSDTATTPDQERIEAIIERRHAGGTALLHVGVGNSSLARRLAGRWDRIDGLTVSSAELELARTLDLPGYQVVLADKYDPGAAGLLPGPYDVVVDNNPTSFACCRAHQDALMERYAGWIAPGGVLLTDRAGMAWTVGDPRWAITVRDLAELAEPHGLVVRRETRHVVSLSHAGR